MAEILYDSGVIIRTSSEFSVVAISIDGSSKSFVFSKRIFYTFGIQCDGDMTNILEDGTEVDLCYKVPHHGRSPCILAVWLGEKPDIVTEDKATPKGMYGMNGRVVGSVDSDCFLVRYEDSSVCIHRGVVYRDGLPLQDNESLAVDEEVSFDATPFECEHPSGASHQATCAWVGAKPRMIDRFDLRSSEYDIGFTGTNIVQGTVAVVPNEVVAVVDVVCESVLIKVLLFRSSFKRPCARLGDVIDIGDSLCMRLGCMSVFPDRNWWYAVQASKSSHEFSPDSDINVCDTISQDLAVDSERVAPRDEIAMDICDVGLVSPFGMCEKASGSQDRGFLLNCAGTVIIRKVQGKFEINIKYLFGAVSVMVRVASFPDIDNISNYNNLKVRFDAEFPMSPNSNSSFRALIMWKECGARFDPAYWLHLPLDCAGREVLNCSTGIIQSIPLPDSAIATVDGVPVLVTLESLVSPEEINLKTSSIDTYLSVGDEITAKIEKRDVERKPYFRAVQCYAGKIDLDKTNPPQPKSWENFWGLGELYRREPIVCVDGKCLVTFVSVKRPDIAFDLDLFERGKVFVDGKLADVETLKGFVGQEITFHVAPKHSVNWGESSKGLFVACAWIGEEPPPKLIFKELLAVPKGLVCSPWQYEAVVRSFPLPSHALCYIGYVPVLVLICDKDKNFKFPDLKVGDRLVVGAHEHPVEDAFVILSNGLSNLTRARDVATKEVYRNLTGIVKAVPDPVGKILVADANFEVSFEFCHLRRFNKNRKNNKQWLTKAIAKFSVGKQVFCSVVKTSNKNVPYRAFEVYSTDD